jgi:hypothetical protein
MSRNTQGPLTCVITSHINCLASIVNYAPLCQISNNLILARIRRIDDRYMDAILRTMRARAVHLKADDGFMTPIYICDDNNKLE